MSRRKPRGLRPEEEDLWDKIRHSATPLHPKAKDIVKKALNAKTPMVPAPIPEDFGLGVRPSAQPVRKAETRIVADPVKMDQKGFGRLKRGQMRPDARIDLHGMTLDQAHPALTRFVLDSEASGKRLLLVITGKGRGDDHGGPIPVRPGVLRRQVPHWLKSAPLGQLVLQISQAHRRHGGEGAYYVYLRRRR